MKITIKSEYNEQSKSVTANTKIEVELENTQEIEDFNNKKAEIDTFCEEINEKNKKLFDNAFAYSQVKTRNK